MHGLGQEGSHQEQQCAEGLSPFNPYGHGCALLPCESAMGRSTLLRDSG